MIVCDLEKSFANDSPLANVHCKNVRISTDILWRVFRTLTEPVPYTCTFASVNRRNNEARAHTAMIPNSTEEDRLDIENVVLHFGGNNLRIQRLRVSRYLSIC